MNYPYRISCELVEKMKRLYGTDEHEFLITIGMQGMTGHTFPEEKKMLFSADMLGYVDLTININNGLRGYGDIMVFYDSVEKDYRKYDDVFVSGKIYHVKGYPPVDCFDDEKRNKKHKGDIFITEIIDEESNNEFLEALIYDFKNPVVINSKVLGTMVYDSLMNEFTGEKTYKGNDVEISFKAEDKNSTENIVILENFWSKRASWDKKIKKFVSKEVLDEAENWNDNNSTITEEMIAEAITMSGISMSADGDFTVYYDDGDIFSGHSIVVTGNMGKGLFEANME